MMKIERGLTKTPCGYIHYRHTGITQPRAVVICHINQQSSGLMIELLEAFAGKVHAIAIDYPSCGASDHIETQPTIADYATCVVAVMDALGVDRATSLGEATGAFVAAELAAAYPGRIDGAVLVNCPYYSETNTSERAHAPIRTNLRPSDPSGFPVTRTLDFVLEHDPTHAPVNADQSWMDRINVAQIEAGRDRWQPLHALGKHDLASSMRKIAAPVLIMMGEHFHYTPHLPKLVALAKRCEGEVIAGARFCATWSHAEPIAARTLQFMGVA
ncbi:MAG TPA: alpha/beta hydrolase [Burkholderiales bacterium]|nr:alpha/beta hydrolase [Burkholderiales bacterium]